MRKSLSIAILGTGRVAQAVGERLLTGGYQVVFGSRDPDKALHKLQVKMPRVDIVEPFEAACRSDLVLLAVPWGSIKECIDAIGSCAGKTLVDCCNPLNSRFDGLELGYTTSAAEMIASWIPEANIVKALNTASTEMMSQPNMHGEPAAMFYCGDALEAKRMVHEMLKVMGFEPIDAGPLKSARYLEPLAMLYIDMAVRQGYGAKWGLKVLRGKQAEG